MKKRIRQALILILLAAAAAFVAPPASLYAEAQGPVPPGVRLAGLDLGASDAATIDASLQYAFSQPVAVYYDQKRLILQFDIAPAGHREDIALCGLWLESAETGFRNGSTGGYDPQSGQVRAGLDVADETRIPTGVINVRVSGATLCLNDLWAVTWEVPGTATASGMDARTSQRGACPRSPGRARSDPASTAAQTTR